jgi:hypothetical protein
MRIASPFLVLLVVAAFASVGCRKKEDRPGRAGITSAAVPAFTGKFPHRPTPDTSPYRRVVAVRYVGPPPANDRDDPHPVFELTNLTNEKVVVRAAWASYYDAAGTRVDSYCAFPAVELGPKETKQGRMGREKGTEPKNAKIIEGEVSVAMVGGVSWQNDNLAGNRASRPVGGFDLKTLEARAGERVTVDVYSTDAQRVRLTNVGDRPVKEVRTTVFRKEASGHWYRNEFGHIVLEKPLAPRAVVDAKLEMPDYELERPDIVDVEARAHEVTFTDGTKFSNANLEWQR